MQRRRLLQAMARLLAERGLQDASIGRICARAGVSRRTFYECFEDREACFCALFDELVERLAGELRPAFEGEQRWSVRIRAALTVLLERFDSDRETARVCVIETLRAGPAVLERRRRVLAVLAMAVDRGRFETRHGGEALPLTAEGVVGGALALVHERLQDDRGSLVELVNPLVAMILNPYLGPALARRELDRPSPNRTRTPATGSGDPFEGLSIRFTYRTARVLATIGSDPAASNRMIADSAGIADEGQISRLLQRLHRAGLIENLGEGRTRGEPNAWRLTPRGDAINATLNGTEATRVNRSTTP